MEVLKVPLHRVYLQTELVPGFLDVGVRPTLPVPGIEFNLGNDLAGGRVLPALEVLDKPVITSVPDELTSLCAHSCSDEEDGDRVYTKWHFHVCR